MSKVVALITLFVLAVAAPARAHLVEDAGSPYAAGRTTFAAATGDFNGDGLADLAAPAEDSDDVTVLLRRPDGGYAPAPGSPFAVGERPADAVAADFDGDGRSDLVVWRAPSGQWFWLTSSSGWSRGTSRTFGSGTVGDMPMMK